MFDPVWKTEVEYLTKKLAELERENAAMKAVVEAAREFNFNLSANEYRIGTSVWLDGDDVLQLNRAFSALDGGKG